MPALLPAPRDLCLPRKARRVHKECVSSQNARALPPENQASLSARFCSELTNFASATVFVLKDKHLEGSHAQDQSCQRDKGKSTGQHSWRLKACVGSLRRSRSLGSGHEGQSAAAAAALEQRKASLRKREAYYSRLGFPPHQDQTSGSRQIQKRPVAKRCNPSAMGRSQSTSSMTTASSGSTDLPGQEDSMSRWSSLTTTSDSEDEDAPVVSEVLAGQGRPDSRSRMKYLQKLSYERVWLPRVQRPVSSQTVIIFDWDDTLLCTSFLNFTQMEMLPVTVKRVLAQIEKHVLTLLELALSLGQTFIITNAAKGWVENSAAEYLPGLLPMLERVSVISARNRYMSLFPGEMSKWKRQAFLELQQQFDSQVVTNLVSLGDSDHEMEATVAMGKQFEKAAVKTVKFQEAPSAMELVKQQELVCNKFEKIVGAARDLKVQVVMPHRQFQL